MLEQLNTKELFAILDCEEFEELKDYFDDYKYKQLLTYKNKLLKLKNTNRFSPSLLATIDDASTPVNVLWGLTTIVGAGLAATIVSSISLGLIPIISAIFCYYAYDENKNAINTLTGGLQLLFLKNQAVAKILHHFGQESTAISINDFVKKINKTFQHCKGSLNLSVTKSIGVAFASGFTLFGSFYLGMSSMISAIGFVAAASALSGPIGMAIAIGFSLIVGVYIGYKHYQVKKNKEAFQACQKALASQLKIQNAECHRQKTIAELQQLCGENTVKLSQTKKITYPHKSKPCLGFFNKVSKHNPKLVSSSAADSKIILQF